MWRHQADPAGLAGEQVSFAEINKPCVRKSWMKLLNINTLSRTGRCLDGFGEERVICNLAGHPSLGRLIPVTAEGLSKSNRCRYQNIHLARFDPLQRAEIKIRQFGELFLCHRLTQALSSQIAAQAFELVGDGRFRWHAIICRNRAFCGTVRHAVI